MQRSKDTLIVNSLPEQTDVSAALCLYVLRFYTSPFKLSLKHTNIAERLNDENIINNIHSLFII